MLLVGLTQAENFKSLYYTPLVFTLANLPGKYNVNPFEGNLITYKVDSVL